MSSTLRSSPGGERTRRPVPFRRDDKSQEDYLVTMHYMAELLWLRGSGAEAMATLFEIAQSQDQKVNVG